MKKTYLIMLLLFCSSVMAQTYKLGLRCGVQYNQLYDVGPNYSVQYVPNYEFLLSENVLRKWNWSMQLQQGFASHFYIAENNNTGKEYFNHRAFGFLFDFSIKKSIFGKDKKLVFAPFIGLRTFFYYHTTGQGSTYFGLDCFEFKKLNFFVSCYIPMSLYSGLPDKYDLTTYQLWGSERFVISAGVVYKIIPKMNE